MAREFADGKRKAVTDYFCGVLNVQRYPGDFPTGAKVALNPPCERLFHYLGELPALRGGELFREFPQRSRRLLQINDRF
jgi:hypothetical protein